MKQKGLSCFHLSLLSIFVLLLVPILVFSQEPPNIEFKYEYAAKIVCGVQKKSNSRQIGRGLYTTSVNIYNPNDTTATFFKKLVLTYPPGGQKQGKILPITTDFLRADGALQSDCFDLERRLFPNGLPTSFIEGFLVIKSTHSLDVTSVHTASKLGGFFSSQKVTSIDVERIKERKIPPPDVTIKDIQINQAIQDAGHSIQLVAQRSTAVRVTLDTKGKTVSNITGTLHAFVDGVAITPPEGLNPINAPFTAPSSLDMNAENSTLNFELSAPSGIAPSDDVDFIVDIAPLDGEPNITNNRGERTDLEFVETRTPRIFFVRVNWAGTGLPALNLVQAGTGDAFVRGIYPVVDILPGPLYNPAIIPVVNFPDNNGNGSLDFGEGSDLLDLLAVVRQLIVIVGVGATDNTFVYGWIKDNPIPFNGLGRLPGFVAFGNTDPMRHQRTFAHELGHNFGLFHNSRQLDPDTGWDVNARLAGNPAGNDEDSRVRTTLRNDIMVAGLLTDQAWVDTDSYNFFLNRDFLSPDGLMTDSGLMASLSPAITLPPPAQDLSRNVLVIHGQLSRDGGSLESLKPIFQYPWFSQPSRSIEDGRFAVEITGAAGQKERIRFNGLVSSDEKGSEEFFGFFEVMVAQRDYRIVSLQIVDMQSGEALGGFKRSNPPSISITSPKIGEELRDSTRVIWNVSDDDTPEEQLLYQIAYSFDGGKNWIPVGMNVARTSYVFNSSEIPKSRGQNGILRVFVSDGLNTSSADVSNLKTLSAKF